jgi:rhodanese-related sulfurtransferase
MRALGLALVLGALLACGGAAEPPAARDASQEEVLELLHAPGRALILDVRTREEFAQGHLPGATSIPHEELRARLPEIIEHRELPVIVHCESGRRAGIAIEELAAAGFHDLRHLEGDMRAWRERGLPTEHP